MTFKCSKCGSRHYKANRLVDHIKSDHAPSEWKQIFQDSIKNWADKYGYPLEGLLEPGLSSLRIKPSDASDGRRIPVVSSSEAERDRPQRGMKE